jgi:hypothetical protein
MKRRAVYAAVSMAIVTTVLGTSPAFADVAPPGCLSNSLDLTVSKDRGMVRNGDTINYSVSVSNSAGTPCNVTGVDVNLYLPAANGQPGATATPIAVKQDYLAGTTAHVIGTVPYTVALNPGVTIATVRATATGDLHDVAVGLDRASVEKTLGTGAIQPAMTMTKSASPSGGQAPLPVTYTYTVTNISTTPVPIAGVAVSDNLCAPVTYVSGDVNGNAQLDVGETFTFTCTTTYTSAGTYVNTASSCGASAMPGDSRPVCAGPVTATVTVTAPPVVLASERCIAVPKSLSLRARELTTVRVQVNAADGNLKGAVVRISGPGFSRRGTTNAKGVVVFKVRPTKRGTLTITSDRCLQAERASVKGARQTQSRRVPRVTG